jgi:hypothetical protein
LSRLGSFLFDDSVRRRVVPADQHDRALLEAQQSIIE